MILGVTGVIGSGKSTVCKYLQSQHGFVWIEADKVVRRQYERGMPGYKIVEKEFGREYVSAKCVSRKRLRELVLTSSIKLRFLNISMGPIIFKALNKKIKQICAHNKSKNICIEAFYFSKIKLNTILDRLIGIECANGTALRRSAKKMPTLDGRKMLLYQRKNQEVPELKITNNKTKKDLYKKIDQLIFRLNIW